MIALRLARVVEVIVKGPILTNQNVEPEFATLYR